MEIKDGKDYISQVKDLIIEYTKRLNRDLSFQNIDEEFKLDSFYILTEFYHMPSESSG